MKITKKLSLSFLPILITSSIVPFTTLTSCSKQQYSKIVKEIINEFKNIAAIPRPCDDGEHDLKGSQLTGIRDYVIEQAKEIGIKKDHIHTTNEWNNIWFDVEANDESLVNLEPLVLQVHMDMVVAGMSSWEEKTKTPINVDVDWKKGIIHSKDYKTSLGADDGIGLSIILTFLKHKEIKHGPIRVVCTTEEDSGMYGASYIYEASQVSEDELEKTIFTNYSDNAKTPIKYVLNVDGEEDGTMFKSSAASSTFVFEYSKEKSQEKKNESVWSLKISGLKGGHSGVDIGKGRANADRLVMEFLYKLSTESIDFQLYKLWHPRNQDGKIVDISYQPNQIVENSEVIFGCNCDKDNLQSKLGDQIASWKQNEQYNGEDWNNLSIDLTEQNDHPSEYISSDDSELIAKLVGKTFNNTDKDCLKFGVIKQGETPDHPIASANISPTKIEYKDGKMHFSVFSQTRASNNKNRQVYLTDYYENETDGLIKTYEDTRIKGKRKCWYPAWEESSKENKMIDLLKQAYKSNNIETKVLDMSGGCEISYWYLINENLFSTLMGARIDNCHTTKETCYIPTIQHCLDAIKYVALKLPKVK